MVQTRKRARREKKSTGRVITELARKGLAVLARPRAARKPRPTCGFRPFAKRGHLVTNELIDRLREKDVY